MTQVKRVTVSFRQTKVGGEVKLEPDVSDEGALLAARHLVLLIHGYNNSQQEGLDAYNGFHARQQEGDRDARYGLARTFVEVYWPGDADWGMVTFLCYMQSLGHARESAAALANYLLSRVADARIDIVAHSMGCRVALELLRELDAHPPTLDIERMVFMAGAVPTFMLVDSQPSRRLRPAYERVLHQGARNLYSGADKVLSFAFPLGQSLAPGEEGAGPTALGHEYWVDPTVPSNLTQIENPGAGHSDYWGWNTEPESLVCSRHAARQVREYLQFPAAVRRDIGARQVAESTTSETREPALKREPLAREPA